MEPELWRRVEDLFHRALELEPSRRGNGSKTLAGTTKRFDARWSRCLLTTRKQKPGFH